MRGKGRGERGTHDKWRAAGREAVVQSCVTGSKWGNRDGVQGQRHRGAFLSIVSVHHGQTLSFFSVLGPVYGGSQSIQRTVFLLKTCLVATLLIGASESSLFYYQQINITVCRLWSSHWRVIGLWVSLPIQENSCKDFGSFAPCLLPWSTKSPPAWASKSLGRVQVTGWAPLVLVLGLPALWRGWC